MIRIKILIKGRSIGATIVYITFPKSITTSQLEQLKAYNMKFGSQISNACKQMGKKVITFADGKSWDSYIQTDNFDDVIKHAEKIPICDESITEEKFIVGDKSTKKLPEVLRGALTYVTTEECREVEEIERSGTETQEVTKNG